MANFHASTVTYNRALELPSQNVHSQIERTNDFIRDKGVPVNWEKAILCPCSQKPGYNDPTCPICGGRGIAYLTAISTIVMFTHLEGVPNFMEPGLWMFGLGNISTPYEIKMSNRDRITLVNYPTFYIELIPKKGPVVRTRFDMIDIEYLCYRKDKRELMFLNEESDFTHSTSYINFVSDVPDVELSIRYRYYLKYIVMTLLHEARGIKDGDDILQLPNQYLVRREDMVTGSKARSLRDTLS